VAGNQDVDVDVVVVGAGPVGLTLANILGLQGVRTLVVDERESLIDYPRGVGLDDESLRTFQAIGLVDRILPHTVPNQILRFVDAKRRVLAEMAPPDARFGWPKRNGFVQPLVDAELLGGLDRFEHVDVWWRHPMTSYTEADDVVMIEPPPPAAICSANTCRKKNVPLNCRSISLSICSSVVSRRRAISPQPVQLIAMSTRPWASTALRANASTSALRVMSQMP